MNPPLRLALIYGSAREGRFCDVVGRWAAERVVRDGRFAVDVVDPAAPEGASPPRLDERIAQADAFLVVTPEYNHGYPAALKALIDTVGEPWHAKPVAFVSYGGVSGGLRAVEQLRQVFAELHAVTVRDTVSFANAPERFDAEGALLEPARPDRSMATLLARLAWWGHALRQGRAAAPYRGAVA
ncbi:NAD(P)H-dependent oxidoreductase [Aquabacterium sp. A7-Y]|uniref:NADPH-dependent FMN reductase n=1 Tax=Aquabacterium sp. A7-Y TaxID=1349605 RepID=UPI00223D5FB5|nr:NAD(P)H-dependent oxidoreductase [Aquabacterium sp. A7-Y]MCW7541738.1 NAD(P)H-dependent oxidoreductase [Aquabacterium sp. A7-Y]